MPGKLKAKIVAGRHLPVMDRASDLTDAFVEVKFGNTTFKTDVCPKSLNPQWNSEWFKFEVDDEDLQDEPLQVTVLDHDTYSANDAIGKVYIDIDPLLCSEAASVISGWFPIYDTIHGIRGEINVLVKVELFNDLNRFRQSSCGVKFFCTSSIPRCYKAAMVHGFVEELVVNEDPEYQWIDRIRTPRASNEARQRLISLMSGELQRKIGLKVLEMGGNAVVGYLQCFDLEGESGLVVRAIGTACTLDKLSSGSAPNSNTHMHPNTAPPSNACNSPSKDGKEPVFAEDLTLSSGPSTPFRALPTTTSSSSPPPFSPSKPCSRQSSSSDTDLSLTPKTVKPVRSRPGIFLCPSSPTLSTDTLSLSGSGSVICGHNSAHRASTPPPPFSVRSDTVLLRKSVSFTEDLLLAASGMGNGGSAGKEAGPLKTLLRQQTQTALEQREFPFFTLTSFPPGFLVHVGGVVSARSVKLLDRIHNPDEPETRDAWWEEIRQEIKSHAKALGCHAVVGYSESTSICEEVCILSASGTAAILNPRYMREGCLDIVIGDHRFEEPSPPNCGFCHIPYDELNMPFPAQLTYCYQCRRQKVPDVLFTTIDLPPEAAVTGKGCLIQARLCRLKKKAQGEVNATAISNLLPFMEYELHTQLMNKLKLRSMNALFGLHIQISVGENMLLGLAVGVYLTALPAPGAIQIAGKTPGEMSNDHHILTIQKRINDTIAKNKELYQITLRSRQRRLLVLRFLSPGNDPDFSAPTQKAQMNSQNWTSPMARRMPLSWSCNTENMPGIFNWTSGVQMFTSVRVFRLSNANLTNQGLNKIFTDLCENLLKSFYFKLRSMIPCCLCKLNFTVAVPEEELIQVAVTAVAMTFDKDQNQEKPADKPPTKGGGETEEQLQFPMELCADAAAGNTQQASKTSGVPESTNVSSRGEPLSPPPSLPATSTTTTLLFWTFILFTSDRVILHHSQPSSTFISFLFVVFVLFSFFFCSLVVVVVAFVYVWLWAVFVWCVCVCVSVFSPAASVDYGSFADRCSTWLELLRLKAHTIRRGSVKTSRRTQSLAHSVSSLERCSPLPEGRSRSLRSTRSFGSSSVAVEGGVSGFLHSFIAEVFAMVRAHVAALGGNAVVSYSMKECMLMENPNKNQAQCLINVSGDAVICVRETDPEPTPSTTNIGQICPSGTDVTT
ncbi:hypothetical protein F7725_022811 [Dissostichus mawsoni]|uniref:C2 domain-containing protein 5 n=1 Tax=Dissostichus mawsoni TaxID=36200 RepID=A0A7J5YZA3_DISMA|nr:hypothetical protein F7725_022811 [Dissostichus mawsoni]